VSPDSPERVAPVKNGEVVELTGTDLAFGGDCVCRTGNFVVFVPRMAPGDLARVRITQVRPSFARGVVVELLSPGPGRADPPCQYFGACGGCQWMHLSIEAQREAKEKIVRGMLAPLGLDGKISPIQGGASPLGYRNRLILPVRAAGNGFKAGFFRGGSHDIIEIGSCPVQQPALWAVARGALELLHSGGLEGWDEVKGTGFLRHLVVRIAAGTGETGVVLVTAGGPFPAGKEIAEELMRQIPSVKGVARNINTEMTNVIFGPRTEPLAGVPFLNEEIAGLKLRASLAAFFQANHEVTAIMLEKIREWTSGETGGILDLYCGAGLIGLAIAGQASWLAGVEEEPLAVADARINSVGIIGRAEFHAGKVEEVLPRIAGSLEGLGTVVVDPPRKGLAPEVLSAIAGLSFNRLVYVSCDPATFTRDLKALVSAGFLLEGLVPLDMFPQSYHIELVAKLRRNTKT
jgi:23S rRNA (uracil1939-C5)-methyltransferase